MTRQARLLGKAASEEQQARWVALEAERAALGQKVEGLAGLEGECERLRAAVEELEGLRRQAGDGEAAAREAQAASEQLGSGRFRGAYVTRMFDQRPFAFEHHARRLIAQIGDCTPPPGALSGGLAFCSPWDWVGLGSLDCVKDTPRKLQGRSTTSEERRVETM